MQLIIKINNALPNILQLQNVYLTNSLNKINTPMKKLLLLALIFTAKIGFAQTYQQGDIVADFQIQVFHDSSSCATFASMSSQLLITVSNSFLGDTLLVKDGLTNYLISTEINSSGMNPWMISVPLQFFSPMGFPTPFPIIEDYGMTGPGPVNISTWPYNLKNGSDSIVQANGMGSTFVNDPCSYGTVSGTTYADYNNNCVFDVTDGTFINYQVQIWPQYNTNYMYNGQQTVFDNNMALTGQYTAGVQESFLTNCVVTYSNAMLPFAYPNGCTPGIYAFNTFPQTNLDFALQCTSNIDVAAYVGAAGPVRPGIPFMLFPHVSNIGCDTASGSLQLILDNRVTYNPTLSSVPPTTISGDTLIWNYGPISNLSNNGFWNSLTSGLHLTPDTTVNIGDTLCFSVNTNVPSADINAANNQYSVCYPVVNSYDPNIKEVSPKGVGATGIIPPTTTELTYTVHFQNTGNASAINVYIIDTLDVNIIPESIEIIGRSHTMTPAWLAPGVMKFSFNNINLADSFSNEPASHGFVTFKAKLENNLNLGTVIENTAYIYFDFNAPIVTNTAINTIDLLTSTSVQTVNANVSVYPNPAKEELFISINNLKSNAISFLEIYNIAGQKVLDQSILQNNTKLDLSGLSKGLYLLKTNVEGTVSTVKIVKE